MDTTVLKRGISFLLFLLCLQSCKSQYAVIVDVGGIENKSLKTKIDGNAHKLLTEINQAFVHKTVPTLTGIVMNEEAKSTFFALWETSPFRAQEGEIYDDILSLNKGGMELRNIRLFVANADSTYKNQEGVIVFTKNGDIDDFYFSIGTGRYKKVMAEGKDITDLKYRETILRFIENLRTSYNRKDLVFLHNVFLDANQLNTEDQRKDNFKEKKVYLKQIKSDYISKIQQIFAANDYLNIKFDELKVVRHGKYPDFYGVTFKQQWNTIKYTDENFVFFLIDFRKQDAPEILISTIQPRFVNGKEIDKRELFNITSFGKLQ